jgi:cytochrome c
MRWARPSLALGAVALLLALAGGGWWWRDTQRAEARADRLTGGDPSRGQRLLRRHGCTGCHEIPGVRGADGRVGPSLDHFAGRVYIAGVAENSAVALIQWLEDPQSLDPRTAMPRTGIDRQGARDVAAFLYTLR